MFQPGPVSRSRQEAVGGIEAQGTHEGFDLPVSETPEVHAEEGRVDLRDLRPGPARHGSPGRSRHSPGRGWSGHDRELPAGLFGVPFPKDVRRGPTGPVGLTLAADTLRILPDRATLPAHKCPRVGGTTGGAAPGQGLLAPAHSEPIRRAGSLRSSTRCTNHNERTAA